MDKPKQLDEIRAEGDAYRQKAKEQSFIFPVKMDERNLGSLMPLTPDTIDGRISTIPKLSDNVPEEIKKRFERLIRIYRLSPFEYELHSVIVELTYPIYESALRFAYWINLNPKGINKTITLKKKSGEIKEVTTPREFFFGLHEGWRMEGNSEWKGLFKNLAEWATNEEKKTSLSLTLLMTIWELRNYGAHPMHNDIHWLAESICELTKIAEFCNELFR